MHVHEPQVFQLRARYPNRGFPKIFDDEAVGEEAKRLYADAQTMLNEIVEKKLFRVRGIISFYPANAVGDDIEVYTDESRTEVKATYYGLRQQQDKDDGEPFYCLSDFIASKDTGLADYIGMFAVSTGFGCDELCKRYMADHDDYSVIMAKALADRLAEAFAEKLHE
jgi:5-methyltetrahydrofolate--homocysteine methyltransferase